MIISEISWWVKGNHATATLENDEESVSACRRRGVVAVLLSMFLAHEKEASAEVASIAGLSLYLPLWPTGVSMRFDSTEVSFIKGMIVLLFLVTANIYFKA